MVVINYDILPFTPAQIAEEREETEAKLAALGDATDDEDIKVTRKRKRLTKLLATNATRRAAGESSCKVLLVFDEAHYVENNKALRTVRARHLASKATRLYGLTGTPVESEPLKLWGLLSTLRCNPFTWTSFLTQFNGSAGHWGGYEFDRVVPRPGSTGRGPVRVEPGTTEILSRCMLRRTKDQVLTELPPKVHSEIPVALTQPLTRELDEIAAEHIDALLSGELPPFEAMSAIRKALAQACIPTMLEIVESYETAGIPLGVFSAHRGPVEALAARKGWYTITGDTSATRRGEIQDEFQTGEGLGVAGTRAMAEAMTLTRASTVLFVDRFWERKHNEQAEDRFHRIGQHDSVNVITLVPDHPLTRHVAELLGAKYAFVDSVLHGEHGYETPATSRFDDVGDAEWKARVDAKAEADRKREATEADRARARRERELAAIAEREVSPKVSEQRATLRSQRLGINIARYAHISVDVVRNALAYMLVRCDGAVDKEDEGFNRPDGCVARWLAPAVAEGLPYAVASMAALLRHYPRQLQESFPTLFTDPTPE
jgi:superfamily II DNA or RNA helicase